MYVRPAEVAIIIMTFAEYLVRPISKWSSLDLYSEKALMKTVAILALGEFFLFSFFFHDFTIVFLIIKKGTITCINYMSVKCFVKIQNVFTVCKVAASMVVIGGGMYQLFYLGKHFVFPCNVFTNDQLLFIWYCVLGVEQEKLNT